MRGGIRAAAALGVGYMLGRHRKLRTAAMMAAATAVGGKGAGGMILQRGMKKLTEIDAVGKLAPQLGEIAETVRGDLVTAGKAAATTAISNRVDSLTDSIHERAERLRNPEETVSAGAGQARDAAAQAGSSAARATSSASRTASSAAGRAASPAGGPARRPGGRRGAAARGERERDVDERDDDEDEVDEYAGDDRERAEPDDYQGAEPDEDDYEDEDTGPEDYEGAEPDEDEEADRGDGDTHGRAPALRRRATAPRRSPVSRARR